MENTSKFLALDTELVQTSNGNEPTQISIVNYNGDVVYESYITPRGHITSATVKRGINRKADVAKPFDVVRAEILPILEGKTIIGHDLQNDFRALELDMSRYRIIDTAYHPIFMILTAKPRRLKNLSMNTLHRSIQDGKHNAKEDALATMNIVKKYREYLDEDVPLLKRNRNLARKIVNTETRRGIHNGGGKIKRKATRKVRK